MDTVRLTVGAGPETDIVHRFRASSLERRDQEVAVGAAVSTAVRRHADEKRKTADEHEHSHNDKYLKKRKPSRV